MAIELKASALDAGTPLRHFWNECVGAGRANEGLRADWQEQLRLAVATCGFRYIRFHGLFHDDMFVYREGQDGQPIYNFQYIDILFDRLLEIGIKPFVELGFCPADLTDETGTVFWWKGHGAPPKDYHRWGELVSQTVTHWIGRYGVAEVRSWYFEVWNEPNLHPFFRGTKSQYFELYRVTVSVIKAIDPLLRVGGPSTSNFVPDARFDGETEDVACHRAVLEADDLDALDWRPVWLEQFLGFCKEQGLPVDFVSCHPYPTDWALDEHGQGRKSTRGIDATQTDLKLLRKIIDDSAFPDAEIHLTEWSSSSSPRDFTHDYLQAATFVVKTNLASIGTVDSLSYWVFTDIFEENGAGDTIFHGGFGMINLQGVVKPTFHAYRFLNALGDEVLVNGPAGIVTRHSATGKLSALVFHYPPEVTKSVPASFETRDVAESTLGTGRPAALSVTLTGLVPGSVIQVETLSRGHGDAMTAWQVMGAPEQPTRDQVAALRNAAHATIRETFMVDTSGRWSQKRNIESWSILLFHQL